MLKKYVVAVVFMMSSQFVFAQQPDTLSLSEAINKALDQNSLIKVAKNEAKIDANNANWGNAGLLPTLSVNGSYNWAVENTSINYAGNQPDQNTSGTESSRYNASVDLRYTLFDGFGNYYELQKLQTQEEVGVVGSRLDIENTLLQVVQGYLRVISEQERLSVNREIIDLSLQRYERAQREFELGGQNRIGLLNAQVALNQDSIRYVETEAALSRSKRDLMVLLGEAADYEFTINKAFDINENLQLAPLEQSALETNATLVISRLRSEQARLSLKQSKTDWFPRLDGQASYSYNRSESEANLLLFQETDGFSAGVTLSFDIFDGFRRSTQVQNAEIRLKNSRELRTQAEKEARRDVYNAYDNYTTNLFLLDKQDLNVETAKLNFERTQSAFELGQVTNTEFREAQLNLLQARLENIRLRINAKVSEVQLLQLAGLLIQRNS